MKKRLISLLLVAVLCAGFAIPAMAKTDVDIKFLTEAVYDTIGEVSEGLVCVVQGATVRYLDTNGNIVIDDALKQLRTYLGHQPNLDNVVVGNFSEGLACVQHHTEDLGVDYAYFIDTTGKVVFELKDGYYWIGDCKAGVILANDLSDQILVFDKSGKVNKTVQLSTTAEYAELYWTHFSDSMIAYREYDEDWNISYGYLDANFKVVIPAEFKEATPFNNGLAMVQKNDLWGMIDKSGKFVAQLQFDNFAIANGSTYDIFSEGLAAVSKNGKWGYIDAKGNAVIPFTFDTCPGTFLNGIALSHEYGCIDKTGKIVLKNTWDDLNQFINGVSVAGKGGTYSLINTKGDTVTDKTWQFDWTLTSDALVKANLFIYSRNEKFGLAKITFTEITYTAQPTTATVLVNGEPVSFDAYNIMDNNYFKLRDLAYVLSGTEVQFEVTWDAANDAIGLITGKAYTPNGSEMQPKGAGNKTAVDTTAKIFLDGKEIKLTAYNIDGNNYFKLRDLGAALDFGIDWDGATSTITIDTSIGYTA